jgi:hypothetical protein
VATLLGVTAATGSTAVVVTTPGYQEGAQAAAGLRGPAFSKMSQHISNAPPIGHVARHTIGWNHLGQRAYGSGRNVPRVDLEVIQGRAFGDR